MKYLHLALLLALASSSATAWNAKRATGNGSGGKSPYAAQQTIIHANSKPHRDCLRVLTPDTIRISWTCPATLTKRKT